MPHWSHLKKRVEALFAPSVGNRVELRITGYRWNRDGDGRAWITVDGIEVHNFCTFSKWRELAALDGDDLGGREALAKRGVLAVGEFTRSLADYCALSFDEAIASPFMLHRALSMLDRRLGKRRLKALVLSPAEHPLVRQLLAVRLETEGVRPTAAQPVVPADAPKARRR